MFERFSVRAGEAIFVSRFSAGKIGGPSIDTEDLLFGILTVDPGLVAASGSSLTVAELETEFPGWRTPSPTLPTSQDMPLSEGASNVLQRAVSLADEMGCRQVRTEHLLLALLLESEGHAAKVLSESGSDVERLRHLAKMLDSEEPQGGSEDFQKFGEEFFSENERPL